MSVTVPTDDRFSRSELARLVAAWHAEGAHLKAALDRAWEWGAGRFDVNELGTETVKQFNKLAALESRAAMGASLLRRFDEIPMEHTDWALQDRIPERLFTRVVGVEGGGKTAYLVTLAAGWTRGTLPGVFKGQPINVAIFAPEDHTGSVLRPRVEVSSGDPARMFELRSRASAEDKGWSLPDDADRILDELSASRVKVLICDPLAAVLDPTVDSWKDTDVRRALGAFVEEAGIRGITVIGTQHTNKSNSTDPRARAIGSVGWRQLVRSSLYVGPDPDAPDDKGRRAVAHEKNNVGPLQPTLAMQLRTRELTFDGKTKQYVFAEIGEPVEGVHANDIIAVENSLAGGKAPRGGQAELARMWLRGFMASGEQPAVAGLEAAKAAGLKERTVNTVKKELGIESVKRDGAWYWRLHTPELS